MFSDNVINVQEKQNQALTKQMQLFRIKPRVDIYETEDEIVVMLEMPNVNRETLQVKMEGRKLHISGVRENEPIKGEYLFRETRDVVYERIFEIEDNLDGEKTRAAYLSGVLKVSIAKKEKAKPRVIEVQ